MNPDGGIWPSILLFLFFVFSSAFLTTGKTAFNSAKESALKKAEDNPGESQKSRKLLSLLRQSEKLFSVLRLGITLCNVFAAAIAAGWLLPLIGRLELELWATVLLMIAAGFLLGCLLFLLGRLIPYRLALKSPENTALSMASPLSFFYKVFSPIESLLSVIANGIFYLCKIDPNQLVEQVTEEEIRMMVDLGNESGSIEKSEREMINNIFEFDDRTAGEVMTHRTEMIAVPADITLPELIAFAQQEGYSRIPVYEEDIDNIIGVLYVKDLLLFVLTDPPKSFDVRRYKRKALFVPETTPCQDLLQQLKARKLQMAIVVDEYGGTSGIVTMEDLLEAIVGNIQDEYDDEEEEILKIGENSYLINGTTSLDQVEKLFEISFPEDTEYDTLGGYITEQLDHIPTDQEQATVIWSGVEFTVVSTEERRITKIRGERLTSVVKDN